MIDWVKERLGSTHVKDAIAREKIQEISNRVDVLEHRADMIQAVVESIREEDWPEEGEYPT